MHYRALSGFIAAGLMSVSMSAAEARLPDHSSFRDLEDDPSLRAIFKACKNHTYIYDGGDHVFASPNGIDLLYMTKNQFLSIADVNERLQAFANNASVVSCPA